jgi:Family of unknown function (DUF6152)
MSASSPIRSVIRLLSAAALLCVATVSQAHHSFAAEYDSNKPVNKTGVMTKLEWTNPHVYLYIDVMDEATGKVTNWAFEMGPPHMLQKAGWKRNELKIGEELVVDGWMARDGGNTANARRVVRKATGEVLGAATSNSQTRTSSAESGEPAP